MPSAAVPSSLSSIAGRVDRCLADLLAAEQQRWEAFDSDLAEPVAEIARLVLAGGKRLRPAFCHWGFVGAGGDPDDDRVVRAGAAFELMHAFALFHDDVMDDAPTRRGRPPPMSSTPTATPLQDGRASRAASARARQSWSAISPSCTPINCWSMPRRQRGRSGTNCASS